jgi:tartrate-resistant acid phosphatase type 5
MIKHIRLNARQYFVVTVILIAGALVMYSRSTQVSAQEPSSIMFAAIGDFGSNDVNEQDVAYLVKSWNPDFIITLGDNNYPDGEAATIDAAIGKYYHEYIYPYRGTFGAGASVNKFWPCIGNRDWDNQTGPKLQPYLDYFTLPNNERYYDFVRGPVHFFCIDSDIDEPDGITSSSVQAQWLRNKLAASTEPWKLVYFHHPAYSSRTSWTNLQWPFQPWGVNAVLSGHAHVYERVMKDGIPFFTNGLGGDSTGSFNTAISGSVVRFGDDYGAMRISASATLITFEFITRRGVVIDTYSMGQQQSSGPAAPSGLSASVAGTTQINLTWTDNANNETGFNIERCSGSGCSNFTQINQTGADVTSFSDSGLSAGTTYRYRVRAFNGSGNSGYSNVTEATTQSSQTQLAAPSELVAMAVSSAEIDLRWKDNSTTEEGFKVYRSTDGVNFTRLVTLGPNETTYANTGRPASTKYYYRVLAFAGSVSTAFSNIATATTLDAATTRPNAPGSLTATALSPTQVKLTWSDNSTNEVGFRVYRSPDGVTFSEVAKLAFANLAGYTDATVITKTTYYYRVRAYNKAGNSGYSNVVTIKTP